MNNLVRWILGAMVAVLAVGWAGSTAYRQRVEIRDLEERQRSLDRETLAATAEVESVAQSAPPAALSAAEKIQLMTLRSRVTELSEIKRRAAKVTAENTALSNQAATLNQLASRTFPPGWVRRGDAKSAGFGSPEAAFESFLWALEHRDTNVLYQALVPEMHEALARRWQSAGPEQFWKEGSLIPGFRLTQVTTIGEGEVRMEIEMVPGMPLSQVPAIRTNGQWRIRL